MRSLVAVVIASAVISTRMCTPCSENRLHEYALTHKFEDAWVCHQGYMYDIGINQTAKDVEVEIDKIPSEPATIYHIHPVVSQDGLGPSPPSFADVMSLDEWKKTYPDLKAKVLDGTGVWTYDTTPKFTRSLEEDLFSSAFVKSDFILNRNETLKRKPLKREDIDEYIQRMRKLGVEIEYKQF